ncbi:MAG TPA: outer membrane beta-barrel protein [Gallionella sp.]|nr:outer membrane beta-barrel protein [Gallionella sp.]
MNRISLAGTALVLVMAAGDALAANSLNTGAIGLNVGFTGATALGNSSTPATFMINGRYFVAKDVAVAAGLGLSINDSGAPSNSKSTDVGFMAGIRKYLKTDDLAPFVGGRFQYLSTQQGFGGGANDVTDFALVAEAGAEYFLAKQFSLEGSVGFGYASSESKPVAGGTTTKATSLGTTTYNVAANFYF